MSEQAPRSNPRLENFEANKAAHEQAQYEQELYGEAGATDFSDEAKKRLEETDVYERHLESMVDRDDDYDEVANNLEDDSYADAIDRRIATDPKLRRMEMIAKGIAKGYATEVTPENADRLPAAIKDKEDKLQELLIEFSENSTLHPAEKEEIMERIINMSEGSAMDVSSEATLETPVTEQEEAPEADNDTADESSEETVEQETTMTDEGTEVPVRHKAGINPESVAEIDPNAIPGADVEVSEEEEAGREFNRGDKVRVQRTSGEVEDGWEVIGTSTSEDGKNIVVVGKDGVGTKRLTAELLSAMQAMEITDTAEELEDEDHEDEGDHASEQETEPEINEINESIVEGRWKTWAKRAKDAVNGGLTKVYFGLGWTLNGLSKNERKEGETDEEYQERMKRNGRRLAIGITAVAVAAAAYKLYNGIDSGSGGSSNVTEHLNNTPDINDIDKPTLPKNELLDSTAWNIPEGSGGEALMDRLGVDKSVWYEHQNEFLQQFPDEAYRMPDGNVGFDNSGRLSREAIDFWSQYAQK